MGGDFTVLTFRRARHVLCSIPRPVFPAAWALVIVVASMLPQSSPAALAFTLNGRQALAHILAYGFLACLTFWAMPGLRLRRRLAVMLLGPILFGGLVEVLQPLAGRATDWQDFLSNSLGAGIAFAAVVAHVAIRRARERRSRLSAD